MTLCLSMLHEFPVTRSKRLSDEMDSRVSRYELMRAKPWKHWQLRLFL